jgi:hypothetical protein
MGSRTLSSPIVGMSATPDGKGYYLVSANGGVFSFGDAYFLGSEPGQLPAPIVGIVTFPGVNGEGGGYWEVGAGGAVYPFGIAKSYSSMSSTSPIVAMASSSHGLGYWLAAANGHVWDFGDAVRHGWTTAPPTKPIVALTVTPDSGGYWELGSKGHVYPHGNAVSYDNGH